MHCAPQNLLHPFSGAIGSFGNHRNIAYRFMPPERLDAAIKLSVTTEPVAFTRIFLMWRGVTDDEMPLWGAATEKQALEKNWKGMLNIEEESPDSTKFRLLETGVMESVLSPFGACSVAFTDGCVFYPRLS